MRPSLSPPAPDEFELSIFGPGYGESIAIHSGDGRWLVVDSCVDPQTKAAVAPKYIADLGFDPARAIEVVVATHWHDDHVRGLFETLERCSSARFICSAAHNSLEFLTLVEVAARMPIDSGLVEFGRVLHLMDERGRPPEFALVNREFKLPDLRLASGIQPRRLTALSPSDSEYRDALAKLGALVPGPWELRRRLPAITPNTCAVVLVLRIGALVSLLGSDLEESGSNDRGWSAVVAQEPGLDARFFKVPHHGAESADHPPVWQGMVSNQAYAALTPFRRGGVALPTVADRKRIGTRTSNCFLTSSAELVKRRRPRKIQQAIDQTVRTIGALPSSVGHVRFRLPISQPTSQPMVEHSAEAIRL